MGTEESVSVLREGDICLDKQGVFWKVIRGEFPYEHEGWVVGRLLKIASSHSSYMSANSLTRIDPAFYKLYGIEECDNESTIG